MLAPCLSWGVDLAVSMRIIWKINLLRVLVTTAVMAVACALVYTLKVRQAIEDLPPIGHAASSARFLEPISEPMPCDIEEVLP